MSEIILIDTCYWISLYDADDGWHEFATELDPIIDLHQQIIPWPTMYEFLNTKFYKRPEMRDLFKQRLQNPNTEKLPDEKYRLEALSKYIDIKRYGPKLSLVDLVIREILMDESIKINAFVTFNARDFADICALRRIELVSH